MNKVGRPKLKIEPNLLKDELSKYKSHKQTGVQTYKNLGVGKTSFYKILKQLGVKRK